jgi:hypothetical protein
VRSVSKSHSDKVLYNHDCEYSFDRWSSPMANLRLTRSQRRGIWLGHVENYDAARSKEFSPVRSRGVLEGRAESACNLQQSQSCQHHLPECRCTPSTPVPFSPSQNPGGEGGPRRCVQLEVRSVSKSHSDKVLYNHDCEYSFDRRCSPKAIFSVA